ncbi:cytosine permease [Peribacillus saganii]|nr:cytosine permease [Peribacillus saganii]
MVNYPQNHKSDTESIFPVLKKDRKWSSNDLLLVSISNSVATWCFLMGGFAGYFLNAKMGSIALIAGSMIGIFFVALALVPITTKYGLESVITSKLFFGNRGWIIALILQYISVIGWNSILLIFFGKAASRMLIEAGLISAGTKNLGMSVLTLIALIFVWFSLRKGAISVRIISKIIAVIIMSIGAWMFYMIINNFGISGIAEAKPLASSGDKLWDYVTGVEIGLVSLMAWWPYIGGMVRVVPKTSQATIPAMLGLGLPVAIMSIIGLFSILVIGDSDPTSWMTELGGVVIGSIALLFIALANFGSAVIGVYISSLGLRHIPFMQKLSWNQTTGLALMPVALIVIFIPGVFFDNFGTFLTLSGVLFAPLIGIQIVDYHLFRNRRLDVKELYNPSLNSSYTFLRGWNPAGILGMVVGFFTYLYLLDPITYESNAPYQYVTATLPTMFIGAFVYWTVTKWIVIPRGWGGYK